jgi:hypothetical protein
MSKGLAVSIQSQWWEYLGTKPVGHYLNAETPAKRDWLAL